MNRLAMLAIAALVALAVACGDDDATPGENLGGGENPNGPAEDVGGAWLGTYASDAGTRTGALCLTLDQDDRELNGELAFEGEPVLRIGGTIANDTMAIVWSPQTGGAGTSTPGASTSLEFITGGTLTGTVSDDTFEGTWTSLDTDRGTWTAARSDTCS